MRVALLLGFVMVAAACGGKAVDDAASSPAYDKGYPAPPAASSGDDCCDRPVQGRACLDVPSSSELTGAEFLPTAVNDPVSFATKADLEDFLRGDWMLVASSHFPPGSYSPLTGLELSGTDDAFRLQAITWDSGGTACTYVNTEKYYTVETFTMLREAEGSDRWVVRFQMTSMPSLAIVAIAADPPRMRLDTGAVLTRF